MTMESVPKDGSDILLWFEDEWKIGSWLASGDPSYPFVWMNQNGNIMVRPWHDDPEPTHWTKLPDPPVI